MHVIFIISSKRWERSRSAAALCMRSRKNKYSKDAMHVSYWCLALHTSRLTNISAWPVVMHAVPTEKRLSSGVGNRWLLFIQDLEMIFKRLHPGLIFKRLYLFFASCLFINREGLALGLSNSRFPRIDACLPWQEAFDDAHAIVTSVFAVDCVYMLHRTPTWLVKFQRSAYPSFSLSLTS